MKHANQKQNVQVDNVGKTSAVHKAIVKIKEGQTIELFGSEE